MAFLSQFIRYEFILLPQILQELPTIIGD